jgi:hypothetical protein
MTANEACLHNPGPRLRTYEVIRPHLPPGRSWVVDGGRREREGPLAVTVPPGGAALVRIVSAGLAQPIAGGGGCSVLGTEAVGAAAAGGREH